MNKKLITIISVVLVFAISLSTLIFVLKGEKDYMKNETTVDYLSTAIRVMSDSEFKDFDLAKRIYLHAFSNGAKIIETFGETADNALTVLLNNDLSENYKNSVVIYGGNNISTEINGLEEKFTNNIKESSLYVGDILALKNEDAAVLYIKDKENFLNLSDKTQNFEIENILNQAQSSEAFVLLRPMKIMENYDFITESSKLRLNEYQEAVIATAESYLLRGDKLQYADTRLGSGYNSEFRWKAGYNTPEDCTSDEWGYTNCAAFCYDVYFHGLGYDMEYSGNKLYTTANFAAHSENLGICVYKMSCDTSDTYTEEDKEKIKKEILDSLEPADILVVRRANGNGHAMIYEGDGNIIHSSGSVYNLEEAKEVYEASIRRMRFNDYFFGEGKGGYIFGSDIGSKVISFYIIRPLKVWDEEIPDQTKNRINNLQGVIAQKTSSHNSALTVNKGEEITYTFEIYNTNDKAVKLEICDTVPTNTEYVSGGEMVDNKLYWNVEIPANTREEYSYKVKVTEDAKSGDLVQNSDSTVGGVKVVTKDFVISPTFTKSEQNKLSDEINKYEASDKNGLEIVNEIYKSALDITPFDNTKFEEVFNGEEGVFSGESFAGYYINSSGKYLDMLAPSLYGGRKLKMSFWSDRTRLARESNLVVGDVLIRKTSQEDQIYIYAGDGEFYNLTNGYKKDTITAKERLETCLATGYCYAILRPSFAVE